MRFVWLQNSQMMSFPPGTAPPFFIPLKKHNYSNLANDTDKDITFSIIYENYAAIFFEDGNLLKLSK